MKISIITATYNSAKTVRDTIETVLSQTWQDYEHIFMDGGSTDETESIVKQYAEQYGDRLVWCSGKDKGLYDAMNKGIAKATGDVIGILNSDDFYTSNDILYTIAKVLCDNPATDAVYGDIHYVNADNVNKCIRYYSSRKFSVSKMRMGYMPAHPSFYCKKECYNNWGVFDLDFKVAADFENLLRLIYIGQIKIQYIEKDFVTMRIGGTSTSGISSHKQIISDHFKAFKKNNIKINPLLYFCRYPLKLMEYFPSIRTSKRL